MSNEEWDEVPAESFPVFEEEGQELEAFSPALGVTDLDVAPELSYEEAQSLTEHIRAATDVLYVLIQRAHAGKAWKALGYASFGAYVGEEFNISRSRAYQLLNQASIIDQIASVAPEGTRIPLSEAAARDLKTLVSDLVPEIAEGTEGASPEEAEDFIKSLVEDYRDNQRSESSAGSDGDFGAYSGEGGHFGGGGSAGEWAGGSSTGAQNGGVSTSQGDDDFDLDFDPFADDDLFDTDSDPRQTRLRIEATYNLYNALTALKSMPDHDQLVEWIALERRDQVTQALPAAVKWLTDFSEHWARQSWVASDVTVESPREEGEFDQGDAEDIFADLDATQE